MFERGFKTWCEKYATTVRGDMGLDAAAPLDTVALAKHLRVRVWTPHNVSGLSSKAIDVLLRNDGKTPSCWSAVTLVVNSKAVVILNSSHSAARQASDLAHELAHRIRGHAAREVSVTAEGLMLLRDYDKNEEEEADWLSGCLLLPREALILVKRRRLEDSDVCLTYGVSQRMLGWRVATTGVQRQFV